MTIQMRYLYIQIRIVLCQTKCVLCLKIAKTMNWLDFRCSNWNVKKHLTFLFHFYVLTEPVHSCIPYTVCIIQYTSEIAEHCAIEFRMSYTHQRNSANFWNLQKDFQIWKENLGAENYSINFPAFCCIFHWEIESEFYFNTFQFSSGTTRNYRITPYCEIRKSASGATFCIGYILSEHVFCTFGKMPFFNIDKKQKKFRMGSLNEARKCKDTHNFQNLKNHILPLSVEKTNFEEAKEEWELDHVMTTIEFDKCPCSHPIKEHCYMRNKKNGNCTYVGNVCVRRFMDIDTGNLFSGLARIKKNTTTKPNLAVIEYVHRKGYLYGDNEYGFLKGIRPKKKLTPRQESWLEKINRRIILEIVVRRLDSSQWIWITFLIDRMSPQPTRWLHRSEPIITIIN